MEIRRTANAGVLLKLDGISVLLDGVCREVKPYLATPLEEQDRLLQSCPDIVAFSHTHKDHCDPAFAAAWQRQTGRAILCPEEIGECRTTYKILHRGGITVIPVESRHIGKQDPQLRHASYILQGSRCVWFLGDASPLQWKQKEGLPKPDVLIAPYAYAASSAAWDGTKSMGAKHVVLLHLPLRQEDPYGLWEAVEGSAEYDIGNNLLIPELGQCITVD